jgi:hypothetical protein
MNRVMKPSLPLIDSEVRGSVPLALSMLAELERHCIEIWRSRRLSEWKEEIDKGEMPDFAPNLKYRCGVGDVACGNTGGYFF